MSRFKTCKSREWNVLHTHFWGAWIEVEWHPCCRELIVRARVQLLVGTDSLLEFLFPYVAPRANSVADNFDVELRHHAQSRPEHTIK